MIHSILIRSALAACFVLALMPATVLAQSSIVGVVETPAGPCYQG